MGVGREREKLECRWFCSGNLFPTTKEAAQGLNTKHKRKERKIKELPNDKMKMMKTAIKRGEQKIGRLNISLALLWTPKFPMKKV